MRKPSVGVVIVNRNLKDSLRETLESVRKLNYPDLQVVVSDNASSDGAPDMVRRLFPEVRLLAHEEEQGYARAASLGMAELVDKTNYIFSTTNDVLFDPEMLNVLVDYAEQHPQAGVLGTKIYFFDRPTVLWHGGGRISPVYGHITHIGLLREDRPRYSEIRECDFVTGCGFLLRSALLKEIGYFKEDLIFYCEDADLCYRAKERGYGVVYVPQAKMWHKVASTLAKNRPLQLEYGTRNTLYLLRRYRIGLYPLSLLMYLCLVCLGKIVLFALLLRRSNSAGIFRGVLDWHQGRYGWIRRGAI